MSAADQVPTADDVVATLLAAVEDSIVVLHHVVLQGSEGAEAGEARAAERERAKVVVEHVAQRVAARFHQLGDAIDDADAPSVECAKFLVEHADALIRALIQLRAADSTDRR